MVAKKPGVPDAWDDDDWEVQADRAAKEEAKNPTPAPVLSKSERLAEHTASNRKLWEAAESNETFHFLEANNPIPAASTFKPQVKVLSRKPVIAKRGDPSSAMGQLSLNDDDDDDAAKKEKQLTPEELRAKQKRDRDEKQRRYDEARAKIFGESAPSSRGSSPGTGTVTPPRNDGRYGQQQQGGRGRGRGGSQRDGGRRQQQQQQQQQPQQQQQQQTSTASPARELYDPNYSARPDSGSGFQRRDDRLQNRDEGAPIRAPKGPDGSGRGGFGFARRGA